MKNAVQLIAYADRLSGGGLAELDALLRGPLRGLFGGVHVLPFFDPIDGADAGFDPVDHTRVDARLGGWDDVAALGGTAEVMADLIVNHVSRHSPQFSDFAARGDSSAYAGMFLTRERVFPAGGSDAELAAIYRPRPGLPFTAVTLATGERRELWTTFTPQQVDIDVNDARAAEYLDSILLRFATHGVRAVRLDAVGYAIKKAGTSCFMLPETFAFIDRLAARSHALGMEVLVEVHAHHEQQIAIARRVDYVYDFALPPLVLHAFAFGTAGPLKAWLGVRPANAVTVLDTHDGIGIVDIGADGGRPGLVTPHEQDALVERIHEASGGASRLATGAAASNLDLYQVNCTYYDALGRDDRKYLLARAIQLFVPGIPQIYYVGLLAGGNDLDLLARTGVGRDINRHYYGRDELLAALERPVVRSLCELIRLRNSHPAFQGSFEFESPAAAALVLRWENGEARAELAVDFARADCRLHIASRGCRRELDLLALGNRREAAVG
jgi:sucrose phosphorylase